MPYKVLADRWIDAVLCAEAGTTVYEYRGHDYGLIREDDHFTGMAHKAVTSNEDGSGPFFTIPVVSLERL